MRQRPTRPRLLQAMLDAFSLPDLRRRILITLGILVVFRFIAHVPLPGVNMEALRELFSSNALLGMLNLFSGGALLQLSIFALGIMPYITASIIVQLLTVVIPRFETLKEDQSGTAKLTQYTRYLTIGLAVLQSTTLVTMARTPSRAMCSRPSSEKKWSCRSWMVPQTRQRLLVPTRTTADCPWTTCPGSTTRLQVTGRRESQPVQRNASWVMMCIPNNEVD